MVLKNGFCDLGFAKLDIDRAMRRGFAEAVYCPGKDKRHLKKICLGFIAKKQYPLLTRLDMPTFSYLKKSIPRLRYNQIARIGYLKRNNPLPVKGLVAVVSAGTADIPVAQEAALTAQLLGSRVIKIFDVGVAGVHRVMSKLDILRKAHVIIVVAGMEGALASLVSGLVSSPVIAVPTSCGYGANFQGLSALLTMLNSCSPGVATVNIDNGFGAGYLANLINKE